MADRLSFDTSFLIDIQKERKAGLQGREPTRGAATGQ